MHIYKNWNYQCETKANGAKFKCLVENIVKSGLHVNRKIQYTTINNNYWMIFPVLNDKLSHRVTGALCYSVIRSDGGDVLK